MPNHVIVDFDDLCDGDSKELTYIFKLKEQFPNFKVTFFTIPALSSDAFLEDLLTNDWIQLVLHGIGHSSFEFSQKSYEDCNILLDYYAKGYYARGFKGPQWSVSLETMRWLRENDFWLAVVDPKRANTLVPENVGQRIYWWQYVKSKGLEDFHWHTHWISKNQTLETGYNYIQAKNWSKDTIFHFNSEYIITI